MAPPANVRAAPSSAPLVIAAALCLLSQAGRAREAEAPRPAELKTLRVLLVSDTNSNLAESVKCDRRNTERLLRDHVPAKRLTIDSLDGKKVTLQEILKYYRDLKVRPDDALLFFYAGHGATDARLGHCLQPQMGETPLVPRAEVRKAMERKGAGLVILLTDCCSTFIRCPPTPTSPPTAKAGPTKGEVELHPVLRCLFFQHRGTVDITAAEDGTSSYGDDQNGGVFTGALASLLTSDLKALDRDRDGFVSWKEFFPQLSKRTEDNFKGFAARARAQGEEVGQKAQRPRYFALPDAPAAKKVPESRRP